MDTLVFQVIQMQEAYSQKTFKPALIPVVNLEMSQYFWPCKSPLLVLLQTIFPDFSGQASILPIFPGAVVQSQLLSMVQLHLDAARTSLCG